MENSNLFKVRLDSYSHGTAVTPTSSVVFDVMPTLTESIQVEYQSIDPVHMPGSYLVYKGTRSSIYQLADIKLVSRTPAEASKNQQIRNTIRGWTKPYFGMGTQNSDATTNIPNRQGDYEYMKKRDGGVADKNNVTPLTSEDINLLIQTYSATNTFPPGATPKQKAQIILSNEDAKNKPLNSRSGAGGANTIVRVPVSEQQTVQAGKRFLGAPPEVLYLTAYSSASNDNGKLNKVNNVNKVPVVITSFDYTYPNDVDYIPTEEGEPFPIIMTLTIALTESHSPREFENFDIFKYRDGKLPGF